MTEATLTVTHPTGLHLRPAAAFLRKAREFNSHITIQNLSRPTTTAVTVSAVSLLQIGARQGHTVCIRAEGQDEHAAIAALKQLIENDFRDENKDDA